MPAPLLHQPWDATCASTQTISALEPAKRRVAEDGVWLIPVPGGGTPAIGPGRPGFDHFGIRVQAADAVRNLRRRLKDGAILLIEIADENDYVSVKFHDPDGHLVEVYWEAETLAGATR